MDNHPEEARPREPRKLAEFHKIERRAVRDKWINRSGVARRRQDAAFDDRARKVVERIRALVPPGMRDRMTLEGAPEVAAAIRQQDYRSCVPIDRVRAHRCSSGLVVTCDRN